MKEVSVVLLCPGDGLRRALSRSLPQEGQLRILESADPREAVEVVSRATPEVVVLVFDGSASALTAIQDIMAQQPTPILLVRAEGVGAESAAVGVESGAVDVAAAPAGGDLAGIAALRGRIRRVSLVPVIRHLRGRRRALAGRGAVVAIAASTGGPQALAQVLRGLGGLAAPVLVVQHLHPSFTGRFLEWMARESALPVEMAAEGTSICSGVVYLAPSNLHLRLTTARHLTLGPEPDSLHRPSADVLFASVAEYAAAAAVGVLLTGMGADGAQGLLAILRGGGRTIVQDEASSAVYGMAKAAQSMGAAEQVLHLELISAAILAGIGARS
jgi:two-component system, chemotaxis family, protein-glutamate methylesterase/glutaminase